MIGIYAKEAFFKSLHKGSISTIPIVPSPDSSRATSAAHPVMSSVNEDGMTLGKTHIEHDADVYRR
jgi:hypothetical protein